MQSLYRDKRFIAGTGISFFFLILIFRKIEPAKLIIAFREVDYRYILWAIAANFVSYFFRAVRWRCLLLPLKKTALSNLFDATIIGYMANNILPARLGELVRAYVLGEKEQIPVSSTFASLVLDRLWDGFTVLLILLLTFFTVRLPQGMESVQRGLVMGGYVTLAVYVAAIVFLVLLKRNTMQTLRLIRIILKPFPARLSEKIIPLLGSFIDGLRFSSRPGDIAAIFGVSILIWATATFPIDLILRSFGIFLPITASMFILVFLVFAVMVPAAPGFVGTYHAACIYGLMAFNVERERALSVALVIHGINFFPVIAAGFFCLWRSKFSISSIRSTSQQEPVRD